MNTTGNRVWISVERPLNRKRNDDKVETLCWEISPIKQTLNTFPGPDRFAQFFNDLTAYLDKHGCQAVDVQYDCNSWSARRVD